MPKLSAWVAVEYLPWRDRNAMLSAHPCADGLAHLTHREGFRVEPFQRVATDWSFTLHHDRLLVAFVLRPNPTVATRAAVRLRRVGLPHAARFVSWICFGAHRSQLRIFA